MSFGIKSTVDDIVYFYNLYKDRNKYIKILKQKSKSAINMIKADEKTYAFFDTMYVLLVLDLITADYLKLKVKSVSTILKSSFNNNLSAWGRSVEISNSLGKKEQEYASRTISVYGIEGLLQYSKDYNLVKDKINNVENFLKNPFHFDRDTGLSGNRASDLRNLRKPEKAPLVPNFHHSAIIFTGIMKSNQAKNITPFSDVVKTGLKSLINKIKENICDFKKGKEWGMQFVLESFLYARHFGYPDAAGYDLNNDTNEEFRVLFNSVINQCFDFLLEDFRIISGLPLFKDELSLEDYGDEESTKYISPFEGSIGLSLEVLNRVPEFVKRYEAINPKISILDCYAEIAKKNSGGIPTFKEQGADFLATIELLSLLKKISNPEYNYLEEILLNFIMENWNNYEFMKNSYSPAWSSALMLTPEMYKADDRRIKRLNNIIKNINLLQCENVDQKYLSLTEDLKNITNVIAFGNNNFLERIINERIFRNDKF